MFIATWSLRCWSASRPAISRSFRISSAVRSFFAIAALACSSVAAARACSSESSRALASSEEASRSVEAALSARRDSCCTRPFTALDTTSTCLRSLSERAHDLASVSFRRDSSACRARSSPSTASVRPRISLSSTRSACSLSALAVLSLDTSSISSRSARICGASAAACSRSASSRLLLYSSRCRSSSATSTLSICSRSRHSVTSASACSASSRSVSTVLWSPAPAGVCDGDGVGSSAPCASIFSLDFATWLLSASAFETSCSSRAIVATSASCKAVYFSVRKSALSDDSLPSSAAALTATSAAEEVTSVRSTSIDCSPMVQTRCAPECSGAAQPANLDPEFEGQSWRSSTRRVAPRQLAAGGLDYSRQSSKLCALSAQPLRPCRAGTMRVPARPHRSTWRHTPTRLQRRRASSNSCGVHTPPTRA
mmetsp:Transcript_1748/g.6927  ORF Transcript_1748/g.6927 Transcript_1748/m.6927 type:complete len:426 (-) Transcript_1748:474-1751(-)